MKISKLFHWLYAILMLLPAFAIGVTCAYAIFNKNAYQSYYGQNINQSQNINLETNTQLIDNDNDLYMQNNYFLNTTLSGTLTYQNVSVESGNFSNPTAENMQIIANSNRLYFYRGTSITFYDDTNQTTFVMSGMNGVILKFFNIQSTPNSVIAPAFYYIQYNDVSFVSEVFYYSIDKVQQSPLFSWANDSFLATPITYITRLFGMPDNNIAILLMSYWLDISIIYLVFDLIMYVPLLVHRWLDKGVLE